MRFNQISFVNQMSKPQRVAGLIYLPLHMFVFPILLNIAAVVMLKDVESTTFSLIYFSAGLLFCLIVMLSYLRRSFNTLLDNLGRSIFSLIGAYFVEILFSYVVSFLLLAIMGDSLPANPNDVSVNDMMGARRIGPAFTIVVILAPIVEEVLFRGVLFGSLSKRNRFLAYALSALIFGVYHIWQHALLALDWKVLLYSLQYIPAGIALAWCYERSGSIWPPILFHMINNLIGYLG